VKLANHLLLALCSSDAMIMRFQVWAWPLSVPLSTEPMNQGVSAGQERKDRCPDQRTLTGLNYRLIMVRIRETHVDSAMHGAKNRLRIHLKGDSV
jgi:hypothetical protein